MDFKLTPYQTTFMPSSAASGGAAAGSSGSGVANRPSEAFSGSLSQAVDAMQHVVQEVRGSLSSGQVPADKTALESAVNGLNALLGQFTQALQLVASEQSPASEPVGSAGAGAGASSASVTDALKAALAAGAGAANKDSVALKPSAPAAAAAQAANPTEQWVLAALNRSIAQAEVNGYDPEKSHSVNTLRGYFSGDAQAKSNAIHSLDRSMLAAGGAYETFDYGVHTIAGAAPKGMDTSMPDFKTAFDKDWNRPSLYDQINSSLGWPGGVTSGSGTPVNFADPANRDAVLNRKLSDAEVAAFQSGQLTPELQAQVSQYRSATMP